MASAARTSGAAVETTEQRWPGFFTATLAEVDPEIAAAVKAELGRQQHEIELIASENIVSRAVLEAQGSVLTNKYAEGYPGKRYYGGCEYVDVAESLAIERAKRLFDCGFANVQPHSGAQANGAVMLALLQPGDTILGMSLDAGGHLTHGARPAMSGKWFNAVQYGVRKEDGLIDYRRGRAAGARAQAQADHRRRLGLFALHRLRPLPRRSPMRSAPSSWSTWRTSPGWSRPACIPSPLPHAHVVTTTTHKTLRGPARRHDPRQRRGLAKKINSAVFPGLQGGPLMHVIAAKAVAFGEALRPEFKLYAQNVVANAKALAAVMTERGCAIVSGGTDNHLMLVDLRPKGVKGNAAAEALGARRHHLQQERRAVRSREADRHLGHPPGHARRHDARLRRRGVPGDRPSDQRCAGRAGRRRQPAPAERKVKARVAELCERFPIYG